MWPLAALIGFLTVAFSGGISREYPKILNGTNGTSGFLPGGYTCLPHSQPWQAALLVKGRLLCGGVLIHPRWVLTAAHCLKNKYSVYLGKHTLGRVEAGEQVKEVARSIPHPQYQISPSHLNHDHDIMLLELESPVQLSRHIGVLPLSHHDCLHPGTCCRVSGWGTTTSPQGMHPRSWRGTLGRVGRRTSLFFFFFFFGFLRPHLWHIEVLRLGVQWDLKSPAHTTATAV
uniref:Peptidase S1 domain-containing protein n=2 Tax=Sus scrofa TaxID=9823 RepID=A0A8D2CIH5_PIG